MERIFKEFTGQNEAITEFFHEQNTLDSLCKICQSSSAICYLIDTGILDQLVQKAKKLSDSILG